MSKTYCFVYRQHSAWQVALFGPGQGQVKRTLQSNDSAEIASEITRQIAESGAESTIAVGIDSHECYAARITVDRKKRRDRTSQIFALEERLPISAEDLTADFLPTAVEGELLGFAVETQLFAEIIVALEEQGLIVATICPTSLLALQHLMQQRDSQHATLAIVQLPDANTIDMFTLHLGKPTSWTIVPASTAGLLRQIRMATRNNSELVSLLTSGVEDSLLEAIATEAIQWERGDIQDPLQAAIQQTENLLANGKSTWINLKRDGLGSSDLWREVGSPLTWAISAAAIFLLTCSIALHVRSGQYAQLATRYETQQQQFFSQLFPGQKIPTGIQSRLHGELSRLSKQTTTQAEEDSSPAYSTFVMLHKLLNALPEEVSSSWDHIQLNASGKVVLSGNLEQSEDASLIAEALTQGGFQVETPQTKALPNELYSITILGTQIAKTTELP